MVDKTRYPDGTLRDYVKGRLPAAIAATIEADARADPDLAAEIALMRGIVKSADAAFCRAPAAELGWARLSRSISADARKPSLLPQRYTRWQVAAVASAAVVIGGFVVGPFAPRVMEQGNDFETVDRPATHAFSAQVTFVPTAQESAIREALRSV